MTRRIRTRPWPAILLVLLALAGCNASSDSPTRNLTQLTGTLTADPLLALPAEAVVTVRLLDVTRADTPAVIGEQILGPAGQFPIRFVLAYDRNRIVAANRYVVEATIRAGRQVIWTSPAPAPVLTQGNPGRVELTLTPAS